MSASPASLLALGAASGAAAATVVAARRTMARDLHQLPIWRHGLARTHGNFEAARLVGLAQRRYDEMYPSRPRFATRAVQAHMDHRILPTYALYRTLLDQGASTESALDETIALAQAVAAPKLRALALLDKVPAPFGLFRRIGKVTMRWGFPEEGWHVHLVEDSADAITYDITDRCPYRDMFARLGAPELAARYCTLDDWFYASLPPGIRFERSGTLAQGCERCDFRFSRVPQGSGAGSAPS